MANDPSPFLGAVRAPIVSQDGTATYVALKLFQDWDNRLTSGLNKIGELIGDINASAKVTGRLGTIGTALQHIDGTGVLAATAISGILPSPHLPTPTIGAIGGVQANAPVPHNWVNSIDTSGIPVLSQPAYGDISGTPNLPANAAATAHNWLNSYTASTGAFTEAQPAFSDISGSAAVAQLPVATSAALGIVKPDNVTITVAAGVITAVGGGAVPSFADAEVPAGLINGVNVTYTLAHSPSPSASLILSLGGMVMFQDAGGDYTLTAGTITFATAPNDGPLLAWYRY